MHLAWFYPVVEGLGLGILGMALHELGHLVAATAIGVRVKHVGFCLKGMYTVREPGPPMKNLMISLAGPAVNVALIFTWPWFRMFALANLCFAVFNLIPIHGSDGDRVLNCWEELSRMRPKRANRLSRMANVTRITGLQHHPLVTQVPQSGD